MDGVSHTPRTTSEMDVVELEAYYEERNMLYTYSLDRKRGGVMSRMKNMFK